MGQRRRNARTPFTPSMPGISQVDQRQIEGLFVQTCQQLVAVARLDGASSAGSTAASARASASRTSG